VKREGGGGLWMLIALCALVTFLLVVKVNEQGCSPAESSHRRGR
jgi:hypothetical protein